MSRKGTVGRSDGQRLRSRASQLLAIVGAGVVRAQAASWDVVIDSRPVPVACVVLPARSHDLTPSHARLDELPPGAYVDAAKADNRAPDEASILAESGVHLVPWSPFLPRRRHPLS
jgi:hypothetical protein